MTPIGPYTSVWNSTSMFIIRSIVAGNINTLVVVNGNQPNTGVIHENIQSAKRWLKENGFSPVVP